MSYATVLRPSATTSYCPYKGDAAYYSVDLGDGVVFEDLIWTYREPYPAVAAIAGRLAFYANRAHVIPPDGEPETFGRRARWVNDAGAIRDRAG